MLVIDPSSECDICFEPYKPHDTPPHTIPCGHVFCKGCLDDLTPHHCPLCREPFSPEHVTKLRFDCQPDSATTQQSNEVDFLRLLVLSLYDSSPPEKFADVMEEAFVWLESQPLDSNELLRSAWVVFGTWQVSNDKGSPDGASLELYRQLHMSGSMRQTAKADRDIKVIHNLHLVV